MSWLVGCTHTHTHINGDLDSDSDSDSDLDVGYRISDCGRRIVGVGLCPRVRDCLFVSPFFILGFLLGLV